MNSKQLVSLVQTGYTTVKCSFSQTESSQLYTYKTWDLSIESGDIAVVKARGEYKVVFVQVVDPVPDIDPDANFDYEWVIQKVDKTAYRAVKEEEAKLVKELQSLELEAKRQKYLEAMQARGLDVSSASDLSSLGDVSNIVKRL